LNARFVPLNLKDFPQARADYNRKRAQFRAGWDDTLRLLDYELNAVGASGVVIQAAFSADKIRNDGWPYGKATPTHPAVIVSFRDVDNRPLSFPCDRYDRWEHNVRAIALSLEALRAVDRHGVTKRGEQYAGFKALEAADAWSVEEAAIFVAAKANTQPNNIILDAETYRICYRSVARILHPDAGGNPHEWKLLGDAKALLDKHHGLTR
jgi:hypothetical protein